MFSCSLKFLDPIFWYSSPFPVLLCVCKTGCVGTSRQQVLSPRITCCKYMITHQDNHDVEHCLDHQWYWSSDYLEITLENMWFTWFTYLSPLFVVLIELFITPGFRNIFWYSQMRRFSALGLPSNSWQRQAFLADRHFVLKCKH